MEKSLVIVESPSKARTINKYLGKDYIVKATVGHIKNLPKSQFGVDIENGFTPTFETIKGKDKVIEELRELAAKCSAVYIATDPDREGEAIAWDIAKEIESANKKIYRVLFHEITQAGIESAMKHPHRINEKLVSSQRARRVMDRIVGYKVSPFIWKTVYYGLSAGRVQSVALRLICEREEAIQNFVPEEYWSIIGEFQTSAGDTFLAKLFRVGDEEPHIPDETTAQGFVADITKQKYAIDDVKKKTVKRNPPPPFITSTLQQEAANRLRFTAKKTMILAQKLYEGVELGGRGSIGLITYMRTDSTRLSDEAIAAVRKYIYENYGGDYLPKEARHFKKGKASQDAHEAIRPTSITNTPKAVRKYLDKDLYALYELIWNRFIACQMSPATFEQITVDVKGGEYLFRASGSNPLFRGFLQVYDDLVERNGEKEDEDPTSKIPAHLRPGEHAALLSVMPRQHFTRPPARYSESTLVKDLETLGIGRPSTYALIVSTIIDRKYVEERDRKLYALPLGMEVNRLLVRSFPDIFNVSFTAKMEEELDTIAAGRNSYRQVLEDFYTPFSKDLEAVQGNTHEIKKSLQEVTEELCEVCGRPMVIKWGRNGRFMACSGYPECKNTRPLAEEQEKTQHLAGMKCDVCGGEMVVRGGKFGTFLGCSNYPQCKNTKPISMGIKCPKCKEGDLIERKTKRRRNFYGCSRYPDCDFASWDKPVDRQCDTCGNPYMIIKYSQRKGEYLKCPACKAEVMKEENILAN